MKRFFKIGLFLSFAAIFSLFVVVSFHHHDEDTSANANHQESCAVCRIVSNSSSTVPPSQFSFASPDLEYSESVLEILFFSFSEDLQRISSPRAPPRV
ncbi:MAG: hypothetical protein KDK66_07810 [Deltaproteobacteria bacterium]|nr:hypothetical protein [Deltaproteobacteria bacterium]